MKMIATWIEASILILWKIWAARNAKVCTDTDEHVSVTVKNIITDFNTWDLLVPASEVIAKSSVVMKWLCFVWV